MKLSGVGQYLAVQNSYSVYPNKISALYMNSLKIIKIRYSSRIVHNMRRIKNGKYFASSHPSPLGAGKGSTRVPAFIGSKPLSKVNRMLQLMGAELVDWTI